MSDPQIFPVSMIERPFSHRTKDPAGSGASAISIPLAVVPQDSELKSLLPFFEEYRDRPARRKGTVKLAPGSFVDFLNRFKNSDTTVLFIEKTWLRKLKITAIFDYHPSGAVLEDTGNSEFRALTVAKDEAEADRIIKAVAVTCFVGEAPPC